MSVAGVSSLLLVAGIRNRIRRQIQRLRQPKYLIATLVGAFYFWSVLGRRMRFLGFRAQIPAQALALMEAVLVAIALATIASAWIFGSDRAELGFSEAEVQFLFPAPVKRRTLLVYRLNKVVIRTFFSALLITLFSIGSFTGHPWLFLLGAWVALSTMMLHLTGASLTRASLVETGRSGLRRRIGTLLVGTAVVSALAWWILRGTKPPAPENWSLESAAFWLQAVMASAPLSWVLIPVRAPIQLALATSVGAFVAALPAALAVAAIHYAWVISSNVSFEEASVEAAERRARALEARHAGRGRALGVGKSRRVPFRLASSGRPEVALIWKNMIAAMRVSVPRVLIVLFVMGGVLAASGAKRFPVLPATAGACVALVGFLSLLGPSSMRIDLRHDLSHMDILRSLPMSGRQVMTAELLGPGLLVAVLQWALLIAAVALSASYPIPGFELAKRVAVAFSLALLAPALSFASLLVQNAGVLLFPSWVRVDPAASRGIEALGQRLLTLAGTMVVLLIAVIPAALTGGIALAVLWSSLRLLAAPFASIAATAVLAAEFHVVLGLLGKLFDRFDVTLP